MRQNNIKIRTTIKLPVCFNGGDDGDVCENFQNEFHIVFHDIFRHFFQVLKLRVQFHALLIHLL